LEDQLLHLISEILLKGVKDPRTAGVSPTYVELTADLRRARIYFTVLVEDKPRETILEGLSRARGYIRTRLAQALRLRRIPEIEFLYDDLREQSARIDDLMRIGYPRS
jgi:ribosome-binding factor A